MHPRNKTTFHDLPEPSTEMFSMKEETVWSKPNKIDPVNDIRSWRHRFILFGLLTIILPSCSTTTTTEPDSLPNSLPTVRDSIQFVAALDLESIGLPDADSASTPIKIGIFFYIYHVQMNPPLSKKDFANSIRALVGGANTIFSQCTMHLELEVAQVIVLPGHLLDVKGNSAGSWGGHPPPGTEDPALFNYEQHERLTPETRELFGYGKKYTSPNTLAVFTVEHITYYAGLATPFSVSGLSFSPNIYHHEDDYPLRNSVLMANPNHHEDPPHVTSYSSWIMAHEMGHMLLNTGLHETDSQNLMGGGSDLTAEQCNRMHDIREWLYGEAAVPDPGPP